MPKAYESMRDKFMKEGMSEDAAQSKASAIYNANKNKGVKGFSQKLSNKPQARFEKMRERQGAKRW